MPGDCRLETKWQSDGSHYDDSGALVEVGINGTDSIVCDVVRAPGDGGGGGRGGSKDGGGSDAPPPPPPGPPGPLLPKPPASTPASAAPACVEGANNAEYPGRGDSQTGSGDIVRDNVETLERSGDLKIDSTSPSRIVSMDVNLGPSSSGVDGANPLEGMSPEEAVRAMYWPGTFDPTYTEVGPRGRLVAQAVKFVFRAVSGDASARRSFELIMRNMSPAAKDQVFLEVTRQTRMVWNAWPLSVPPEIKQLMSEAVGLVLDLLESGPIGTDAPPSSAYIEVASTSTALGMSATGGERGYGHNKGACGQLARASVSSAATLLPGSSWVRITFQSTEHGTLVDRIKAIDSRDFSCPPVHATVTAGQATRIDVGSHCTGDAVSEMTVLTRQDISRLPGAELAALANSIATDPMAGSIFQYDRDSFEHTDPWPTPSSTATFADGRVGFIDRGADGLMTYSSALSAGGFVDHVVVSAKTASGERQAFVVAVEVKAQPSCSGADKPAGPEAEGFRAVIQDGSLQLLRNQAFVLDPKLLCTADWRDTYRVTIDSDIPGVEPTFAADGTIHFTWSATDTIGVDVAHLDVIGWDEVTGVPSAPITVPVTIRDVPATCNDVEIDYDWSELGGAAIEIPLDCAMTQDLRVLRSPFLTFTDAGAVPGRLDVDGGSFTSDGTTVLFTPDPDGTELSTARAVPWSTDPATYTPYRTHGPSFYIDVRVQR
ncbi:hypothetical protein NVV95_04580 [Herbiconiux sp. CPCC 205716]|uniref:Uncharacterized protein n=1 Tax=Herbiconiux gentiana TaxID=2970912 RepID=A0ABT2GFZ7_9MICO|nr:hypothetical protein [Herbiconiux gentiana]MCS5713824.1 hypothetical protein [Herbiconiux gentiana]